MYADLVADGRKRSIKDRLNGGSAEDPRPTMSPITKRQRQTEGILRYDTFKDDQTASSNKVDAGDLRWKLQRKGLQQGTESASCLRKKLSGTVHQLPVKSQKLSGTMHQQPAISDLPKTKAVTEMGRPVQKGGPSSKETVPVTKKFPGTVASNKSSQTKSDMSVDSLLHSLGLEKYLITFKAEEVDMTALIHMTDQDLKAIGLPMNSEGNGYNHW
ncbi:SAM [Musa troglodytarum]|uniref:SAM n=1 Tax=Musa troglodytarum TaxID=320322 RepID=A0A9E7EJ22_9LILI|nr:SAM [Musa troglodytarum]